MLSLLSFPRTKVSGFLSIATALVVRSHALDSNYLNDWREKMQIISPRGYVSQHTQSPPKIDGALDDVVWGAAPWTEDFVDIEGAAKPKPKYRTRAKMLWDNDYLYVAAEMEEPDVWGTLTDHDTVIFQDPDFELFIDPDGDSHNYFEFEMNALNTGWDLMLPKPYKDGGKADNGWEIPGLQTAVRVLGTLNDPASRDEGWVVEIAIPWGALASKANPPAPPREGDQWRMGFSRVEWQIRTDGGKYTKLPNTLENNWVWSPQGVIDMHRPERWGYVQFARAKDVKFVPDRTAPARDSLQELYYAQRTFRHQHGRWATAVDELALSKAPAGVGEPTLRSTPEGWEATIELVIPGSTSHEWKIAHDARIWRSKKP